MREADSSTKTTKLPMEKQIVKPPTITHCYLLMPLQSIGPVTMVLAIGVAKIMSNCPAYGKVCGKCRVSNHFKAVCHSKSTAIGGDVSTNCKSSNRIELSQLGEDLFNF